MIHSCSALEGSSSRAIAGRAKLRIVLSIDTSSTASISTTTAAQPRQSARGPSVALSSVDRLMLEILAPFSEKRLRPVTVTSAGSSWRSALDQLHLSDLARVDRGDAVPAYDLG